MKNEIFKDTEQFKREYRRMVESEVGKGFDEADDHERFSALCKLVAFRARAIHVRNDNAIESQRKKRVFYFSLEFLIGPLLENYLLNLGILDTVAEGLAEMGTSLEAVSSCEVDPGLGNGGLGRLAACFLDSMAPEGIAGYGNGMRYRYGLFRQVIKDGRQVEETDNWLAKGYPWEVRRPESVVPVTFGGEVVRHEEGGRYWFTLEGGETVNAVPYDIPVVGYGGNTVNKLRVWAAEPVEEKFDLDAFNEGAYADASKFRTDVEAISTILYPNDAGEHGRILRLKQEYLFVAAGIGSIMCTFKREHTAADGTVDWAAFPDAIAIHTNDTHPAMCGAELIRVLVDEEGLDYDTAWDIVTRSVSYTNHTVLPEALEKWPIDVFRRLLPRIYMWIEEIDRRYREDFMAKHGDRMDLLCDTRRSHGPSVRHRHPLGRPGAHGKPLHHLLPLRERRGQDPHRHPGARGAQGLLRAHAREVQQQDQRHLVPPLPRQRQSQLLAAHHRRHRRRLARRRQRAQASRGLLGRPGVPGRHG